MHIDESRVDLVDRETVVGLSGAALVAALTGVFALVSIPYPLSPTSVTLQVLGVFLAGLFLGARWGAVSMVLYVLAGAVGAPVYSHGTAGLGQLFSYTGGFLISFPVAAALIGVLAYGSLDMNDPSAVSLPRLVGSLAVATVVIYALGVVGMLLVLELSVTEAIWTGAVVFVPVELLKMVAAIGIAQSGRVTDWPPRGVTE